ncbi:MAG: hypothetical protein AAB495_00235 [Patescibacteria group bacterium]
MATYEVRVEFRSWLKRMFASFMGDIPKTLIYKELPILRNGELDYSRILLTDKAGSSWVRISIPPTEGMSFGLPDGKPIILDEDGKRFVIGLWQFLKDPRSGEYRGSFAINHDTFDGVAKLVPSDVAGIERKVAVTVTRNKKTVSFESEFYLIPGTYFRAPLIRVNIVESGVRLTLRAIEPLS